MKGQIGACALSLVLAVAGAAGANTIASSTMVFEGELTVDSQERYVGIIAMVDDTDFDLYAEYGASAWFGDMVSGSPEWTEQVIGGDHDAWPTWNPDTPDWYQYSLALSVDSGVAYWALRNHPGATADHPWDDVAYWGSEKPPMGVPMSGIVYYSSTAASAIYAAETDVGAYLPGTGIPEIAGGAASKGGGAGAWDMDWSWGSEMVPLQLPGFDVDVVDLGDGSFTVTMTPVPEPATIGLLGLGLAALAARRRRK